MSEDYPSTTSAPEPSPVPGTAAYAPRAGSADMTDDELVSSYGYTQQFARTLRSFESFAVAFSFISITTGLFSTFGFVLGAGGPRGIWTWPIVVIGQVFVALVYGMLASKIPLSGYSYQWASRLANPRVGWWFGWVSFAFLSIVTVAVDYGLSQAALLPLFGIEFSPGKAMLVTLVVLVIQAILIIWSTPITAKINNWAVGAEVIGMVGLTLALLAAALFAGKGDWSQLGSTGAVADAGYYGWLGPFMLATLLGAYTIVGWESASNLAEETHNPRQVVPRAMVRSILVAGGLGMLFLIVLVATAHDIPALTGDSAPVATIIGQNLGPVIKAIALVIVCVSIFACGLVIMVTNSRLIYSMARDGRLPAAKVLTRVPRATGGPIWATLLAGGLSAAIVIGFGLNANALANLLGAATLMPAILYAGTVLLYWFTRNRIPARPGDFVLGRWEKPVVALALLWLAYELVILIGPADFRQAQYYAVGTLVVGALVYGGMLWRAPGSLRHEPGLSRGGGR
ncbi:amino acid permease [Sphaerisporangium sp. NPDC049002]|uniref:amino acid permease n=1 Tax=unclassified Sphaerisporangium TaxID=2630420 RepID=UPI0033CBB55B